MNLTIERNQHVVIVDVPWEAVDAGNSSELKRELTEVVDDNASVVLDISQVQFIDSAGLGAMVWAVRQIASRGGDLRLCNVNGSVQALFELVRMHKLVSIYTSREDAIQSFH